MEAPEQLDAVAEIERDSEDSEIDFVAKEARKEAVLAAGSLRHESESARERRSEYPQEEGYKQAESVV